MSEQLNKNIEKVKKNEQDKILEYELKIQIKLQNEKEENIKNNQSLKTQLGEVSKKIEEILSDYKERKKYGIPINNNDNIKKVDLQKFNQFLSKIEKQKNKTESYKQMLDYDDNFTKISKEEDELKYLINKKQEVKKEYEFLQEINNKQEQDIQFLFNKNFNSTQLEDLTIKLKKLKEDYLTLNKDYKSLDAKIKNQNIEINTLDKECNLIKDNIELKKKQKVKFDYNDIVSYTNTISNDIKNLNNKIKEKKIIIKNQEISYKNQLNEQIKKKKEIEEEVKLLQFKLSNFYQQKKINELKMKEIQKIKNEINKNKLKEKNDLNLLKIKQQRENMKILNLKKYKMLFENTGENKLNFDLKNYALEEERKNTKISNRSYKKPNLNIGKFNSKSSINIFNSSKLTKEERKIKKEKEKEEFIKNLGVELEEHEKQRGKMIQEIEFLKDDIEKVLNKNDIIDQNINDIKKDKNNNNNVDNENIVQNSIHETIEGNNNENNILHNDNSDNIEEININDKETKKVNGRNPFDFAFSNK